MLHFLSTPDWPPFVSRVIHSFIFLPPPFVLSIWRRMRSAANDRKYILEAETGDGILRSQLGLALDTHAETRAHAHTDARAHTQFTRGTSMVAKGMLGVLFCCVSSSFFFNFLCFSGKKNTFTCTKQEKKNNFRQEQ